MKNLQNITKILHKINIKIKFLLQQNVHIKRIKYVRQNIYIYIYLLVLKRQNTYNDSR